MNVTVTFAPAPGERQFVALTIRVETEDLAAACAEAVEQARKITTVPILSVLIEVKQ